MKLHIPKKILIVILTSLCLVLLSTGLYFFIKQDPFDLKIPKLDRYTDIKDWCEYTNNDGVLAIECRALLLEITNDADSNSCFNMLVISKDKELKDLTVCEPMDTLTYTNEILEYKKLMPLDMTVHYTKSDLLNNYSFNNVSFEAMNEEYIHSIVNEDIANLVQTDVESVTTIKNSVNFCPSLEGILSYLSSENQERYEQFYRLNKLQTDSFQDGALYNSPLGELKILFGCESQQTDKNDIECTVQELISSADIESLLLGIPMGIDFTKTNGESELTILRDITIMSDIQPYVKLSNEKVYTEALISSLNSSTTTQEIYCSTYKLLSNRVLNSNEYLLYMRNYIHENIKNVNSVLCNDLIDNSKVSDIGFFIKNSFSKTSDTNFSLINKCSNLTVISK